MKRDIIDRIEELKLRTMNNMRAIQYDCSPRTCKPELVKQYSYYFDGYEYYIYEERVVLFATNDIPYTYSNDSGEIYIDSMINLVSKQKVFPFILFLNGRAIHWSKINIVRNYTGSYLIVRDIMDIDYTNIEIFYYPTYQVRYGEDDDIEVTYPGLYFDEMGIKTSDVETTAMRVELYDPSIYVETFHMYGNNYFEMGCENGQFLNEFQVLGFAADIQSEIPVKHIAFDELYAGYSSIYPYYNGNQDVMQEDDYHIVVFYYKPGLINPSYLVTKDFDREKVRQSIIDAANDIEASIWMYDNEGIFTAFDFNYDRNQSYDTNTKEAMRYIVSYDYSLFNQVFKERSPIRSECYKGSEFKALMDRFGYVRYSRKRSDRIDDYVIVFVNGEIYSNYIDVTYTTNTIDIPIVDIADDDDIEILFFMNVMNRVLNINVEGNRRPLYISPDYNLEDCELFDTSADDPAYNVKSDPNGRTQYKLEYTYTVDEDGYYYIAFADQSHYGKDISIVPKNQFRYYRFLYNSGNYRILLPLSFNYCNNIDRYMVFVNHKKIDKSEFTITIMNSNRPFDQKWLYLPTFLLDDDIVEIFYVPIDLGRRSLSEELSADGLLRIQTNFPNLYSISKDTMFLFINGKKINPVWIDDISMNTLKINTKVNSIHNIEILEYQYGDPELAEALVSNYVKYIIAASETGESTAIKQLKAALDEGDRTTFYRLMTELAEVTDRSTDLWTTYVDQLFSTGNFDRIVNSYTPITNPDKNYKDDYEELHTILYQIVLDFYINKQKVRTGSPFVYDFELGEFKLAYDAESGESIVPLAVSGLEDKLFQYVFSDDYIPSADIPSNVSIQDEEVWFRVPHTVLGTVLNIPYTTSDNEILEATVFEETIPNLDSPNTVPNRINGHTYTLTNGILNLRNVEDYNTEKDLIIRIKAGPHPEDQEVNITSITVPSSVTEFKARVKNVTSINLTPARDTLRLFTLLDSNITNASNLFYNCKVLEEILFTAPDTLEATDNMFRNCEKLTVLNGFDISKVKDLSYMFAGCKALESVHNYITVDAIDFQHMFDGCIALRTIPQFNMTHAKNTSYMFNGCVALESIPRIVTTEVLDMSYMFNGCTRIVSIPELNALKSTNMDHTFYQCGNLVELGLFNLRADTSLESCLVLSSDTVHYILTHTLEPIGPNKTLTFDYDIPYITKVDYQRCTEQGWIISPSPLIIEPSETIPDPADMNIGHIYTIFNKGDVVHLGLKPTAVRVYATNTFDTYDEDKTIDLSTIETPYTKVLVDISVRGMESVKGLLKDTTVLQCENIGLEDVTTDISELFMGCAQLTTAKLYCTNVSSMISTFRDCIKLTTLSLFDTSTVTDMSYMLSNCDSLTNLPAIDTSAVTTMVGTFSYNDNLEHVPVYDTSKVTNMDSMFMNCTKLSMVSLLDTSSVLNMNSMFAGTTSLARVPDFVYTKVESMDSMFKESGIKEVIMKLSAVKSIESMFMNATQLVRVEFLNANKLLNIDNAFDGCVSLTTVIGLNLRNIKASEARVVLFSLNSIETPFDDCTSLTDLDITNLSTSIDLSDCSNLSADSIHNILVSSKEVEGCTIQFSPDVTDKILFEDYWLMYNKGWVVLPEISITDDAKLPPDDAIRSNEVWYTINTNESKSINPVFISISDTGLVNTMDITIYDDTYKPQYTGKYTSGTAFSYTGTKNKIIIKLTNAAISFFTAQENTVDIKINAIEMTEFNLPIAVKKTLKSISILDNHITETEMMFTQCRYLETIGTFNLARVTSTKLMFSGCISLKSIPPMNTYGVADMSGMFSDCAKIKTIPNLDTSTVRDMSSMFSNCTSLIEIPLLDTRIVTDMDYMFKNCKSLTNLPDLDMTSLSKATGMFSGCESLAAIPGTLKTDSLLSTAYMFMNCKKITTIPNIITNRVTDMRAMFMGCHNLETVPLFNTELVTDMQYMFHECRKLITIPEMDILRVTDLSFAFEGCGLVRNVMLRNIQTDIDVSDTSINEDMLRSIIDNIVVTSQIATQVRIPYNIYMNLSNATLQLIETRNLIITGL